MAAISWASLTARKGPTTCPGGLEMGSRQGRLELEEVRRPSNGPDAKARPRSDEGGDDVARLLVLGPGAQLEKPRVMGDSWCLDLGDDQGGLVVYGQHEHRQALERHRLVARQPGQVSPEGKQEGVYPERPHLLAHSCKACRAGEPGVFSPVGLSGS